MSLLLRVAMWHARDFALEFSILINVLNNILFTFIWTQTAILYVPDPSLWYTGSETLQRRYISVCVCIVLVRRAARQTQSKTHRFVAPLMDIPLHWSLIH